MAEIVRTTLTDHRKKAVNVQLVTEALYGPQVRCLLSGLDYCPDDVVNIWEAVSESDGSSEPPRDHRRPIDLSVSSFAGVCSSR